MQLMPHPPVSKHSIDQGSGFTILELLVASTIFAVVLLIVAAGVLSFTNSYYNGVTASKTQAATREIIAEAAQSIQFGKQFTSLPVSNGVGGYCIDNTLYSYAIGQQVIDTSPNAGQHQAHHGLVVTTSGNCSGATPLVPNSQNLPSGRELLGQHMRLSVFTITPVGNLYNIQVRVIYGDDDQLTSTSNWSTSLCNGALAGVQFCAVSDLSTTVEQRL